MTQSAAAVLEATRAVLPELRERAAATATQRRVPIENIELLQGIGSLKTIQATRNGGHGLTIRDHIDMVSTIARGCGSTAWVAGVVQGHSWLLSHFAAEAQDEIYGVDDNAVVAAVIGPRGTATKVDGGYRLSGVWPFASGSEVSSWLLLGGRVIGPDGPVDEGDFAIPVSDVTFHDDWYVVGLSGTGSCTVSVDDVFVPEHRFLSLVGLTQGTSPGMDLHTGWLERCAPVPVLAIALTGSSIGIARQALDDFPPLIMGKRIVYATDNKEDNPITHHDVADAVIRIDEGEMLIHRTADEIDAAGREGRQLPLLQRARMRLDCAEGVRRCLEAVEILFQLSGGSGLRSNSPLTRAVADLRAINQHGLLDLRTNRAMYGRIHLGLPPDTGLL